MKFLTYKDMIKLNHVLWGGMQWESRYNATWKSVKKQGYGHPKDFLKGVQNRWYDRTTSSVQERSEARKIVYFHFIRFGPSGCGGRFWTKQIEDLTDPSWLKASQPSLVFTMNPCKSRKFTFSSFCQCILSVNSVPFLLALKALDNEYHH